MGKNSPSSRLRPEAMLDLLGVFLASRSRTHIQAEIPVRKTVLTLNLLPESAKVRYSSLPAQQGAEHQDLAVCALLSETTWTTEFGGRDRFGCIYHNTAIVGIPQCRVVEGLYLEC